MNAKILTLALVTLIAAETAHGQPASAQGRSARFNFAPNVWKHEEPRVPSTYSQPAVHNVRSGSVPQGKNFLGISPEVLAKPQPAPQVQTQVAARPSATVTTPVMVPGPPQFKPSFGKPAAMKLPPMVASAPAAAAPIARKAENLSAPAAKTTVSKPVSRKHSRNVSGRLKKKPASRNSLVAKAKSAPRVASYGNNVGYVAGPYVPVSSGSGMKSTSSVSGRLLK